jgi:hypothetical protein
VSLYAIYLIVIFTYPSLFPNTKSLVLINKNDINKSEIIISGDSRAEFLKAENITNVQFFNLMENTDFELKDFTDVQHTCIHGNAKFTKLISEILQKIH